MRSKFERTEFFKKFYDSRMGFNESESCYTSGSSGLLIEVVVLQGGWEVFQEQQKKIDAVFSHINHEEWSDEYGDNQCPTFRIKELLND